MSAAFVLALVLALAPGGAGVDAAIQASPVDGEVAVSGFDGGLAIDASPAGVTLTAPGIGPVVALGPPESASAQPKARSDDLLPGASTPAVLAGTSLLALAAAVALWLARAAGFAPWLPFFSRIEDDKLAEHPTRRLALDFIAANPGATVQDVRRALGIAWGTTIHHLGRLEHAGLVAVRHIGGRRGHWPLGQAPSPDALPATGRALAALVHERPGLAQNQLALLLGVGAPAACKQLARLESAGLVTAQRAGHARLYVGTERLASALVA